jgi:hypothetical protein
MPEQRDSKANEAWAAFCDAMKEAGQSIVDKADPDDPRDEAEGFRHLALLVEAGLRYYVGNADPDFPRFTHLNDTPELADNRFAPIRGDASYRLAGNVSNLFDLNVSVHDGFTFLGRRSVWGDIGRDDLEIDDDGNFELVLSAEEQPGNWLQLPPEAEFLHVREYFYDWSTDSPGTFEVTRIGSEGEAPDRLDTDAFASSLDRITTYVQGYLATHGRMTANLVESARNVVPSPTRRPGTGGNSNIWYGMGSFDLDDDDALLLEFRAPKARAWAIQWCTEPWYENADMANRVTSLTGNDAHVDDDGIVRIVVCAEDPGVENWLDVTGYRTGVIVLRWIWCDEGEDVTSRVVRRDALRDELPASSPHVSTDERAARVAVRRANLARRGR